MNFIKKSFLLTGICFTAFAVNSFSQVHKVPATTKNTSVKKENAAPSVPREKETLVEISTNYGIMVAKLYNATPLHRDNFIKLVKTGYYDSLLFHRVINGFMIQGGDPLSKHADSTTMLGGGSIKGDRIPAEFRPNIIHKRGALAAARDDNPAKASSNCQFFIVEGKHYDTAQLSQMSQAIKKNNPTFSYTAAQKDIYNKLGGTPFLDQSYTVFGEVISGLDILDRIAAAQTRPGDRPVKDIMMKMKIIN